MVETFVIDGFLRSTFWNSFNYNLLIKINLKLILNLIKYIYKNIEYININNYMNCNLYH